MPADTTVAPLEPAAARREFLITEELVYLDVASRAPMADRVAAALADYVTTYRTRALPKDEWLDRVEQVRARVARLLGAAPTEVAFTKSTSDGLNLLAHALPWRPGDNVVLCPQLEHANNVYPWLHLRDAGVEVRAVPAQDGRYPVAGLVEHLNARTRVLAVSSVSFLTGARADLAALGEVCDRRGVLLLVDGVQEVGAMRLDPGRLGVGGLAAATQKMLLGMYGLGILYVRGDWIDRLRPPFLTRMGVDWGGGHEADLGGSHGGGSDGGGPDRGASDRGADLPAYRLRAGAPRFEVGNPNFAGLFALDAALSLLEDVGEARVEAHVRTLATRLVDGLVASGLQVVTPADPAERAGIVTFAHPRAAGLHRLLEQAGVTVALRRGLLRASVHVFNSIDDVDAFLEILRSATLERP